MDARAATLRSTPLGRASEVLGTDGARFAAWRTAGDTSTAVYDARRARTRTLADPAGCRATAIGAGALLYSCGTDALRAPMVLDLVTGARRRVVPAGTASFTDATSRTWTGIGRRWLRSGESGGRDAGAAYYARDTGVAFAGPVDASPTTVEDLDLGIRPLRRVCSPVRRREVPSLGREDEPLQRQGRWTLRTRDQATSQVVLQRCGSAHARTLCSGICATPLLTRTHVLWQDADGLRTLRLADGRRTLDPLPDTRVLALWRLGDGLLESTDAFAPPSSPHRVRVRLVKDLP